METVYWEISGGKKVYWIYAEGRQIYLAAHRVDFLRRQGAKLVEAK